MDNEFFTNNYPFAFLATAYNTHETYSDIYRGIFIVLQYS